MAATWSVDKRHSERERWICIYPTYINSRRTISEGRRVARSLCIENPTHQEIKDVLVAAGLTVGVENKCYPREKNKDAQTRGRVRVHLKNDDGTPVDKSFPSRDSVLTHLCEMIPKLKSRQQKQSSSASGQAQQQAGKKGKGKSKGKR